MADLLTTLRAHTTTAHQAMHDHPLLCDLQQLTLSAAGYRLFLAAFAEPLWCLGTLDALGPQERWLREAILLRRQALHADLRYPDQYLPKPEHPGPERAAILGTCYTLIGSSLGAQTLYQAVSSYLPQAPVRFLALPPRTSGWPQLVRLLKAEPGEHQAAVVTAAQDSFASVAAGFDRYLDEGCDAHFAEPRCFLNETLAAAVAV